MDYGVLLKTGSNLSRNLLTSGCPSQYIIELQNLMMPLFCLYSSYKIRECVGMLLCLVEIGKFK